MWIENKIRMSFFNRIISFIFESTRRKLIGARNQMIFLLLLYWTKFTSTADSTELTDKAANDAASIVRAILLDEEGKLVLSLNDFVIGMFMLNEQQQRQQSTQVISSITTESIPDWIPVPSRLQQLFLYAIGPYGMALHWYAFRTFKAIKGHSLLAIFNECFKYLSCTCMLFRLVNKNKGSLTTTYGCSKCDSRTIEAFKQITGFGDQDIVYYSLRNSVYEIPFFVVLDHAFKSVLVLLRGSISVNDFTVDLSGNYFPFDINDTEYTGHKGIVCAATNTIKQLNKSGALDKAFWRHSDYQLMITGHSLGACVASIVSIWLRPKYPEIKCIAFCPAPILCKESSELSQQFCLSVVSGYDCISRTTVESMQQLITRLKRIVQLNHSYKKIVLHWFKKNLKKRGLNLFRSLESLDVQLQSNELSSDEMQMVINPRLRLPGSILHIQEQTNGEGRVSYSAIPKRHEDLTQLHVTCDAFIDHTPDKILRILAGLSSAATH